MAALADLPGLTVSISGAFTEAGIPHAVSGAMAMAAHGFVRATCDIDILVVVPSLRWPEVFAIVRRFGFEGEDRALISSLRERFVAELRAGPASVEILVPALPFHGRLIGRAETRVIRGTPVPCVSAEDLVVLKMLWLRDKDRGDLHALLAARRGSLDLGRVRGTLEDLLPAGDSRLEELKRLAGEA